MPLHQSLNASLPPVGGFAAHPRIYDAMRQFLVGQAAAHPRHTHQLIGIVRSFSDIQWETERVIGLDAKKLRADVRPLESRWW